MNAPSGKLVRNVVLVVVGFVVVLGVVLYTFVWPNSVQSTGNQKEQSISAAYENGANGLSSCINQTNTAAEGANANASAIDKVMLDAVSKSGDASNYQLTNPNGTPNATAQAGLYALFVKAYPDTSGLTKLFQQAVTIATACQQSYQNDQSAVLDRVRDFNSWRTGSWMSRTFWKGQANDNLSITIPGTHNTVTGAAALALAGTPIVNSVTSGAYSSGTYNPSNPFGGSPSATPSASASS